LSYILPVEKEKRKEKRKGLKENTETPRPNVFLCLEFLSWTRIYEQQKNSQAQCIIVEYVLIFNLLGL
jgi:hypothetical protein